MNDAVSYVADRSVCWRQSWKELTGRKLDEARLRETIACSNRTLSKMRRYARLRAEVTQDTTMTGELCGLIATLPAPGARQRTLCR